HVTAPAAHVEIGEWQRELCRASASGGHGAVRYRGAAVRVADVRRPVGPVCAQTQRLRTRQLGATIPAPARGAGLAVHLESEVRLQRVVETQRARERRLID